MPHLLLLLLGKVVAARRRLNQATFVSQETGPTKRTDDTYLFDMADFAFLHNRVSARAGFFLTLVFRPRPWTLLGQQF